MALVDDIGTFLSSTAQNLVKLPGSTSTLAWTYYKGFVPPSPDKVVVATETAGLFTPQRAFADQPGFQIRVRGGKRNESTGVYSGARTEMENVKLALDGITPQTIGSQRYGGMWAESDAFFLGFDENDRPEFVLNMRAWKDRST